MKSRKISPPSTTDLPAAIDTLRRRIRDLVGDSPFMSIPQAAIILDRSHAAIYRDVNEGRLPTVKMNGRLRKVSVIQLERYVSGDGD